MKGRILYAPALAMAKEIVLNLKPACDRIEVAGSLRRRRPTVGDIELVCILNHQSDLFGERIIDTSHLLSVIQKAGYKKLKGKNKYIKLLLPGDHQCDLFITTPVQWGVIFTIRTGSWQFSKWLVTKKAHGGAMPANMNVSEGRLFRDGTGLLTTTELALFNLIGLDYIPPELRNEQIDGVWR